MTDPIQELGATVAREQDRLLDERDDELRRVRARLLARPERQRSPWLPGLALAAVAAAALAFVLLRPDGPAPLTYRVGDAPRPAPVGQWLSAEGRALPVIFSDGTRLELSAGSDGEVAALDPRGADFHLERGHVRADVVHREDTRFVVEAGPFSVHVVGTEFDVAWSPAEARFELHLRQGEVRVSGPLIEERSVVAGEYLLVWAREGRIEVGEDGDAEPLGSGPLGSGPLGSGPLGSGPLGPDLPEATASARPAAPLAAPREGAPEAAPEVAAAVARRAGTPSPALAPEPEAPAPDAPEPEESYDELAQSGRYAAAVAAAEARGWRATLDAADAAPLLRLADAARLAGRDELATQAYERVRERFGGSSRAARATFALGRLAFDRRGRPGEAAGHFTTYLRQAPDGAFAREASGRLIEAHRGAGDAAAARAAAHAYLERYPDGPHAPLARSLAER